MTASVSTTGDEIDAAILTALHEAAAVVQWSELRDLLPRASDRRKAEALVRLYLAYRVDAVKIGGRTYVSLPLRLPLMPAA